MKDGEWVGVRSCRPLSGQLDLHLRSGQTEVDRRSYGERDVKKKVVLGEHRNAASPEFTTISAVNGEESDTSAQRRPTVYEPIEAEGFSIAVEFLKTTYARSRSSVRLFVAEPDKRHT